MGQDGRPLASREKATTVKKGGREITDEDRNYWAYRPLATPKPPEAQNAAWPRNDIDRFLLSRLEAEKIAPARPRWVRPPSSGVCIRT